AAVVDDDQSDAEADQGQAQCPAGEQIRKLSGYEVAAGRAVPAQPDQEQSDGHATQSELPPELGVRTLHGRSVATQRTVAPSRSTESARKPVAFSSPSRSSSFSDQIEL